MRNGGWETTEFQEIGYGNWCDTEVVVMSLLCVVSMPKTIALFHLHSDALKHLKFNILPISY